MSTAAPLPLVIPLAAPVRKFAHSLLPQMKERGAKYGVESMCIGGGMGAAALFELMRLQKVDF
jgi:acetyl-CoA acyltransferase